MLDARALPGRFERPRVIGAGAFGVVYEAYDRERDEQVAVKTLPALGAGAQAFRRTFTQLTALSHPRLVALYDLFEQGTDACYSMRLVNGTGLLPYVRGHHCVESVAPRIMMGQALHEKSAFSSCDPASLMRLRRALPQVADGLAALHAAGHVHGDLTPANVLVDPTEAVLLVDYGPPMPSLDGAFAGTAAYMAPEQGAPGGLGPASDWYALGIVLFEALTGALPFGGDAQEMLIRKSTVRAVPPGLLVRGVPLDLETLCVALLERNPTTRLRGDEALRRMRALATSG